MYRYILFDADNTLFDFDKAQRLSFNEVLNHYGYQYSDQIFNQYETINQNLWHQFELGLIEKRVVQERRFLDFFSILGIKVDGAYADSVYQENLSKQSWLMPNAEKICKDLSQHATLVIVTNGVGKTQRLRIANSKIAKLISFIIVSEDVGYSKPNINFFIETFKVVGCRKTDSILIVGDSIESDIQGGINVGIDTCWYNPSGKQTPIDLSINYIISNLNQLSKIFAENG